MKKKNKDGCYPLLYGFRYNNLEMVQLLINYANEHNIILDLKGKDKFGNYPLLYCCEDSILEII